VDTLSQPKSDFTTVGWVFPGQGSQHVGMVQALADGWPIARDTLAEADEILGFSLSRLCFEGPEELLTDTINAQPALLAASIAALRVFLQELGHATERAPGGFAAGHSMGEYTALVAAGSLAYADGLRLVRTRGRLMKQAGERSPGLMAAILGLDTARVAEICVAATADGGIAQVANDNCPGQAVISGDREGMEAAMAALSSAGAKKVVPLAVSIAAHSPLMAPAAKEFAAAITSTTLRIPALTVFGNTSAQPLSTVEAIHGELRSQLTGSVRWTESVQNMAAAGVTTFVEVGPGEVLSGLVKRIDRSATRLGVRDPDTLRACLAAFGSPAAG
jgi:[acyl-carrier-protein] S-malonyltransferase